MNEAERALRRGLYSLGDEVARQLASSVAPGPGRAVACVTDLSGTVTEYDVVDVRATGPGAWVVTLDGKCVPPMVGEPRRVPIRRRIRTLPGRRGVAESMAVTAAIDRQAETATLFGGFPTSADSLAGCATMGDLARRSGITVDPARCTESLEPDSPETSKTLSTTVRRWAARTTLYRTAVIGRSTRRRSR